MRSNDFLHGFGSVLTIFPIDDTAKINLPNESDEQALRRDWEMVGEDLNFSLDSNINELSSEAKANNS